MTTQTLRKGLIIFSALLFPVTMLYFSPAMVFKGARLGILSGSYVLFGLLFVSALFFGRSWCGWLCPVAGFSEMAHLVQDKPFRYKKLKALKYVIWVIWVIAITLVAIFIGKGFHGVDLLMGTEWGGSIHNTTMLAFYYLVLGIIMLTTLTLGQRGFCHSLCWMAPFMVIGRFIANKLKLPRLQLNAQPAKCPPCEACEKICPMGLPIIKMVAENATEHTDCILCHACVDACPHNVLKIECRSG